MRETVTASPGEGNSAVDAGCEYGNFGPKQVTDRACSQFVVLQTFYICTGEALTTVTAVTVPELRR